jgi:hypothetical protein
MQRKSQERTSGSRQKLGAAEGLTFFLRLDLSVEQVRNIEMSVGSSH